MIRPPRRNSLVAQTVAALREEIERGAWHDVLPGELPLCRQLEVSRTTLRAALSKLEADGLLDSRQGARRKILHQPKQGASWTSRSAKILMLSPGSLRDLPHFAMYWLDHLRERLAVDGCELELHVERRLYSANPGRWLTRLADETHPRGWILYRSTPAMQRWFVKTGEPAIVTGSLHEDIRLPALDVDYRASCRHAAGQLIRCGYRKIILLLPHEQLAGDYESETGFLEAFARKRNGVESKVVRYGSGPNALVRAVDTNVSEERTAFIAGRPNHALTIHGHLLQRGIKIPRRCGLIARDDEPYFAATVPNISRYAADPAAYASRLQRMVNDHLHRNSSTGKSVLLMPKWLSGESVGLANS